MNEEFVPEPCFEWFRYLPPGAACAATPLAPSVASVLLDVATPVVAMEFQGARYNLWLADTERYPFPVVYAMRGSGNVADKLKAFDVDMRDMVRVLGDRRCESSAGHCVMFVFWVLERSEAILQGQMMVWMPDQALKEMRMQHHAYDWYNWRAAAEKAAEVKNGELRAAGLSEETAHG